jgi:hypothetical protein
MDIDDMLHSVAKVQPCKSHAAGGTVRVSDSRHVTSRNAHRALTDVHAEAEAVRSAAADNGVVSAPTDVLPLLTSSLPCLSALWVSRGERLTGVLQLLDDDATAWLCWSTVALVSMPAQNSAPVMAVCSAGLCAAGLPSEGCWGVATGVEAARNVMGDAA